MEFDHAPRAGGTESATIKRLPTPRNGRARKRRLRAANALGKSSRSTLLDCCIATGGVALALVVRKLLDPALGNSHAFVTFYIAVLLAAWFGGVVPALVTMLLGASAASYFFTA